MTSRTGVLCLQLLGKACMTQSMADACQNGEGECRMTVECHCTSGNMSVSTSMSQRPCFKLQGKKDPLESLSRRSTIWWTSRGEPSDMAQHHLLRRWCLMLSMRHQLTVDYWLQYSLLATGPLKTVDLIPITDTKSDPDHIYSFFPTRLLSWKSKF